MRYLVGLVYVLALGVLGCGEATGTGGTGGVGGDGDPFPGNCGSQGLGGGAPTPWAGLHGTWPDVVLPYQACAYVNEDCTELEASTECNIGEDESQAHFLEVEWTDGRTDLGDECAAAVSVTTDLVDVVPIDEEGDGFSIEFTDNEGAAWEIWGYWSYSTLIVIPKRTTEDGVCRPNVDYVDYRDVAGCFVAAPFHLCLETARFFPPEIVNIDFNPKQVDVTTIPANVICEATLTHPSGVDYLGCTFKSPSGKQVYSCRGDSPSSGDIYDGDWSCTVTIPQGEEPGLWDFTTHIRPGFLGAPIDAQLDVISR